MVSTSKLLALDPVPTHHHKSRYTFWSKMHYQCSVLTVFQNSGPL